MRLPLSLPPRCGALTAVALLGWVGCAFVPRPSPVQGGPAVQLANTRSRPLPATLRRVLAFPLHVPQLAGEPARELDAIFATELNKNQSFEVVRLSRAELSALCQQEEIASTDALPAAVLAALRERFAADAVLLTDITSYRPYRPMALGIRARLLDAHSMAELWAVDATLDGANPEVAQAALCAHAGERPEPRAGLVLQSPRRFAAFVAQEIFSTLPPR